MSVGIHATKTEINIDNPCIYVANLGAYNAGRLVGKWLDLTTFKTAEELQEAVDRIANYLGSIYGDEWAIHDYSHCVNMGENPDLEKLLEVAQKCIEEGYDKIKAFLEIYSIEDLDYFDDSYQGEWDSFQEYAENYFDECYLFDVPEYIQPYIDYKKFAEALSDDHQEVDAPNSGVFIFRSF